MGNPQDEVFRGIAHEIGNSSKSIKEETDICTRDNEVTKGETDIDPPLTLRRFLALSSLTLLFMTAAVPVYFITATLGTSPCTSLVNLAYIEADLGEGKSLAWLGMANTLSTAATAPFAGSISDLLGRRYVSLLGSALIILGVVVIGTANRTAIAIGGMAIVGIGAGLAEVIAAAGIMELAPVRRRGIYVGVSFLLYLPIAAGQMYG